MPGLVRLGDSCTGHSCYPSRVNTSASGNVMINGIGAHRVGDSWAVHGCGICVPHASVQASGSGTISINGMPAARVGDSIACGSTNAVGSSNVIGN